MQEQNAPQTFVQNSYSTRKMVTASMVIVTIDKGRENKMSSPETDTKVVVVVHRETIEEFLIEGERR